METIKLMKTLSRLRAGGPFGLASLLGIRKVSLGKQECSLTLSDESSPFPGYTGSDSDIYGSFAAITGEEAIVKLAAVSNGYIKVSRHFDRSTMSYVYHFAGSCVFRLAGKVWKVAGDGCQLRASQA